MQINPATLARLSDPANRTHRITRGIEKESLRVAPEGALSSRPHPSALGSPLTHPSITTDFSESQLELITGVHDSAEACLEELTRVHQFVYANMDDELLWPSSMPCIVGKDAEIPIGAYGTSNIGMAKTVYRRGLGERYGRLMQTISGIHYNMSIPESIWQALGVEDQAERTASYFGLIRNFRRWSWLLIYLFGASPAVCRSFTKDLQHNLEPFDEGSLHLPHATSLRMGPLGYQSSAQSELHVSYNSVEEYVESMLAALTLSYPEYEAAGTHRDGQRVQLNTNIIQIENEFYGTIRPKRRTEPGERPVSALQERGVEYVEVRCLDLNPMLPVGIDLTQIQFIDTFLLLCLLAPSPPDSEAESARMAQNQVLVVEQGRDPQLTLQGEDGNAISLTSWATQLLDACEPIAAALQQGSAVHTDQSQNAVSLLDSLDAQRAKVLDSSLTPSAQILAAMQTESIPFFRFSMNQGIAHKSHFAELELSADTMQAMQAEVHESIAAQAEIEAADEQPFETFLEGYLALPKA